MDNSTKPVVVLVVDDEALIRMYATDVLEDAGFTVVEAENAVVALEMLERLPEIDVLFTDINMPGPFDGLELARKVHAQRPDIQLIIASGKMRPTKAEIPDHGTFFTKPYDGQAIVSLIGGSQKMTHNPDTQAP